MIDGISNSLGAEIEEEELPKKNNHR